MNKFVQTTNHETVSDKDLIVTTVKLKGNVVNREVKWEDVSKTSMENILKWTYWHKHG